MIRSTDARSDAKSSNRDGGGSAQSVRVSYGEPIYNLSPSMSVR